MITPRHFKTEINVMSFKKHVFRNESKERKLLANSSM